MNKLYILSILLLLLINTLKSQEVVSKIVVDAETIHPIENVHVFTDSLKNGTITNSNGKFALNVSRHSNILSIRHLSYIPMSIRINQIKSDTILLKKKVIVLNEIFVPKNTGETILRKVIDALNYNHYVEPLFYKAYVQVLRYKPDKSELHIFSEYLLLLHQTKHHNSLFNVQKIRAKPFSNIGRKHFKDMRLISAISIYSDNIFKFKRDIFKKKKLNKYNIQIVGNNNNTLQLEITQKKTSNLAFSLFIDAKSYAIKKIIEYYSNNKTFFNEISFKEFNNKWYLSYSHRRTKTDLFTKTNSEVSIVERKVIYNTTKNDGLTSSKDFKKVVNIMAEPIKEYNGNWSDKYWQENNYISIPNWAKQIILKSI